MKALRRAKEASAGAGRSEGAAIPTLRPGEPSQRSAAPTREPTGIVVRSAISACGPITVSWLMTQEVPTAIRADLDPADDKARCRRSRRWR